HQVNGDLRPCLEPGDRSPLPRGIDTPPVPGPLRRLPLCHRAPPADPTHPRHAIGNVARRSIIAGELPRGARSARAGGACRNAGCAMLSYQHIYHAGNLADVHKHAMLASLLAYLGRKDKPLTYLETHAGRGLYRLDAPEAVKT